MRPAAEWVYSGSFANNPRPRLRAAAMDIPAQIEHAIELHREGRVEEARALYAEVLARDPSNADATYCLGLMELDERHLEAAERRFSTLIDSGVRHARVLNAMGCVVLGYGRYGDALAWFERALEVDPDFPEARMNRGLGLLRAGRFEEGFEEYEWRWRVPQLHPPLRDPQRLLAAQALAPGRTVLVHHEQGLGDMIHHARYLALLRERGMTIVLEVRPELVGLLDESGLADWVIMRGEPLPDYDAHCPVVSLPRVFGTSVRSIPARVPYLHTDPKRDRSWRDLLGPGGPRVGLVWGGNPNNPGDAERSIPLPSLDPLSTVAGVRWFSLQKGPQVSALAQSPRWQAMTDLSPRLVDFRDTASALRNLDLLITVDTAVAHLAGALAVPTWLLVQKPCDWRWLEAGTDTAWYLSMRIFRQEEPRHWQPVIERVHQGLAGFVEDFARNRA